MIAATTAATAPKNTSADSQPDDRVVCETVVSSVKSDLMKTNLEPGR
jgi:hypothetical protein